MKVECSSHSLTFLHISRLIFELPVSVNQNLDVNYKIHTGNVGIMLMQLCIIFLTLFKAIFFFLIDQASSFNTNFDLEKSFYQQRSHYYD